MVDLLAQRSLDQLLLQLKILFTYVTKQSTLMGRSTVLMSLPLQLVIPGDTFPVVTIGKKLDFTLQ
jgi:hypothetical protein